jgi:hypothetical protein
VAAAGYQDYFDAGGVGSAEGFEIFGGDFELRVQEGAVYVGGY